MDAAKFVQLQNQMKENQMELQDYLRDLEGWEKDINAKDESLKQSSAVSDKQAALPPVRNSLLKKKVKKRKAYDGATKKSRSIPGSDFRAWDKFDVDKALKEIDDNDSDPPSEYETDEEWEVERRKQQALMEKDLGNKYFKEGKYEEAVSCYTKGIECDPTNALLFANRAMALLKQQRYDLAECDCTESISIDPTYVKAYMRRSTARRGLRRLPDALADCEHALKLEPTSPEAHREAEAIKKELSAPASKSGIVAPIKKAVHERSTKPLKRISIQEIGADEVAEARKRAEQQLNGGTAASTVKATVVAKDAEAFERMLGRNKTSGAPDDSSAVRSQAQDNNSAVRSHGLIGSPADIGTSRLSDTNGVGASETFDAGEVTHGLAAGGSTAAPCCVSESVLAVESSESETLLSASSALSGAHSSATAEPRDTEVPAVSMTSARPLAGACKVPSVPITSARPLLGASRVPPMPMTSYQLQADWKLVRGDLDKVSDYVKQIPPASYPRLFGEFLDADVLMLLLQTFSEKFLLASESILDHLTRLAQVKRFNMVIMFLSEKERAVVRSMFAKIPPSPAVSELEVKYGLER